MHCTIILSVTQIHQVQEMSFLTRGIWLEQFEGFSHHYKLMHHDGLGMIQSLKDVADMSRDKLWEGVVYAMGKHNPESLGADSNITLIFNATGISFFILRFHIRVFCMSSLLPYFSVVGFEDPWIKQYSLFCPMGEGFGHQNPWKSQNKAMNAFFSGIS